MVWVDNHYHFFHSFSAEIDFRRQNLTSTYVRIRRLYTTDSDVYRRQFYRCQILTSEDGPRTERVKCTKRVQHDLLYKYISRNFTTSFVLFTFDWIAIAILPYLTITTIMDSFVQTIRVQQNISYDWSWNFTTFLLQSSK